jgi:hypothetical protein
VKQEEEEALPSWGYTFSTARAGHADCAYTQYVDPLLWVPALPGHVYQHAAAEDPSEHDGGLDYLLH